MLNNLQTKVTIGGVPTSAVRISYTGELGWELYHPREHTGKLYEHLLDIGHKHGNKIPLILNQKYEEMFCK